VDAAAPGIMRFFGGAVRKLSGGVHEPQVNTWVGLEQLIRVRAWGCGSNTEAPK
jgi:hypothetical protein